MLKKKKKTIQRKHKLPASNAFLVAWWHFCITNIYLHSITQRSFQALKLFPLENWWCKVIAFCNTFMTHVERAEMALNLTRALKAFWAGVSSSASYQPLSSWLMACVPLTPKQKQLEHSKYTESGHCTYNDCFRAAVNMIKTVLRAKAFQHVNNSKQLQTPSWTDNRLLPVSQFHPLEVYQAHL